MPIDRNIDRIPEDVDKFLNKTSQNLDKLQHQTRTWNGLNRNTEQTYREIYRSIEKLQRAQEEGLELSLSQEKNLDALISKRSKIEETMRGGGMEELVSEVAGGQWKRKIEGILSAFSTVPGLGGLAGLTRMLPGGIGIMAITRVIGTMMKEMDKMTEQFARTRQELAVPGIETWRAGWMEMARFRAELGQSMRRITNYAAGVEEAMIIFGEIKRTGGLQELTVGGERLNTLFNEMSNDLKRGRVGENFHDAADKVALLTGTIDNLSKAYGVQHGAIMQQLRTLRRYTTERETDAMALLEQWHALAYVANEINVSQEDYIKWVEASEKELRFYNFTLQDVNAIAHNFGEELKHEIVSLQDLGQYINEVIGAVSFPREELFRQYMEQHINILSEETRSYLRFIEQKMGPEGMMSMGMRAIREGVNIPGLLGMEAVGRGMPERWQEAEFLRNVATEVKGIFATWEEKGVMEQMGARGPGERALLGAMGVAGRISPVWKYIEGGPLGKGSEQAAMNLEAMKISTGETKRLTEVANQSFADMNQNFTRLLGWGAAISGMADEVKGAFSRNAFNVRIISSETPAPVIMEFGQF